MINEELIYLGLIGLSTYIIATTPTVKIPKFLLNDLQKSKVIIYSKEEIKLPEFNILITPLKPKPNQKYYPWSPDNEILIKIENLANNEVELFIYMDLSIKYPSGYSIIEDALSSIFPFLRFSIIAYNWIMIDLIKSILGKDYIRLQLRPNESKIIRVVFPYTKFSIPIPFLYVEHDLIIKIRDKYGRKIIKEIKYIVGYP